MPTRSDTATDLTTNPPEAKASFQDVPIVDAPLSSENAKKLPKHFVRRYPEPLNILLPALEIKASLRLTIPEERGSAPASDSSAAD